MLREVVSPGSRYDVIAQVLAYLVAVLRAVCGVVLSDTVVRSCKQNVSFKQPCLTQLPQGCKLGIERFDLPGLFLVCEGLDHRSQGFSFLREAMAIALFFRVSLREALAVRP